MRILSIRVAGVLLFNLLFEGAVLDLLAGNYWTALTRPTSSDLTRLSFLDSLRGWVVGTRGTILKTADGGKSWISQNAGITNDIVDVCILNEHVGWAIALQYPTPGRPSGTILLNTSNGGILWNHQNYPVPDRYFQSIDFLDALNGWMGGDNGTIVGTTNGGQTWFDASTDTAVYARLAVLGMEFVSRKSGFAVGGRIDFAGVIWRTTDYGGNWTATAVSPEPLHALHIVDSLNILCVGGDLEYGPSVVTTTDGGDHWTYATVGIFGEARGLSFRSRTEGWAPLGFSATCMFTLDSGRTWSPWLTPDTTAMYDVAFTDRDHGFMVGERGTILKYNPLSSSVEEQPQRPIPLSFALSQNYPNPFNATTIIKFSVPSRQDLVGGADRQIPRQHNSGQANTKFQSNVHLRFVTLTVYDLLGREVATLVNEVKRPGDYEVTFSAQGLASGVYLYRLTAGEFADTKKLLLLR